MIGIGYDERKDMPSLTVATTFEHEIDDSGKCGM